MTSSSNSPDKPIEKVSVTLNRKPAPTLVSFDLTAFPIDAPTHGRGIAWGDIDNDGDQDLYSGAIFVGVGACCIDRGAECAETTKYNCEQIIGGIYTKHGTACDEVECGEGGGKPGVDSGNGENQLFRNDGDGVFTDITDDVTGFDGVTRCCSFVDFDNDGDLDIYLVNSFATSHLLRNDGPGGFVDVAEGAIAGAAFNDATGAAWADIDRDGDMDAYVTTGPGFANQLVRNDLDNGNHWVQVKLVGTESNRSAIGALVHVTAGGLTQMREIRSGSGYFAQDQLAAHFGLGSADVIEELTITWPAGGVTSLQAVSVDQHLVIVEACDVGVDCADCNGNGEPDIGDLVSGVSADCNQNDVPDECDIADATSTDLDGNGVPDECEDCNGNAIPDVLDLENGTSADCNGNGIPDECDLEGDSTDCNDNGTLDECDIAENPDIDQDGDGVIDACAGVGDVNGDGNVDVEDLVTLILNWGPCPPEGPCVGDLDHSATVDVADLVIVILNWGMAP